MPQFLVCLDPGHSGPLEPGAVNNKLHITEAQLTVEIAEAAGAALEAAGIAVLYTRRGEVENDLLDWRTTLANDAAADLFVSIHINSYSNPLAAGVETYHYPGSIAGYDLAAAIQQQLASMQYSNDRGVKSADFYVLRHSFMPAALVECGFLSNFIDAGFMTVHQHEIGCAIAQGIINYLHTKKDFIH